MSWSTLIGLLREAKAETGFRWRKHVASAVIRHWSLGLWLGAFLLLAVVLVSAQAFWPGLSSWDITYLGFALSGLLGVFTLLGLLVSVTVLHSLRELIPNYTFAADAFTKVIRSATHSLLVLTENPAFMQVLDRQSTIRWLQELENRISQSRVRVVFAYVNRAALIDMKYPTWARSLGTTPDKLVDELFSSLTFAVAKKVDLREQIKLVPLGTSSLPFYLAIADGRKVAMFCHSVVYPLTTEATPGDVRESILRGFVSYDEHIVEALRAVYLKFLQLNAAVYEYSCDGCGKKDWLFDHDLLRRDALHVSSAASAPDLRCEVCNGTMHGVLRELIDLEDEAVRDALYKEITGAVWQD